jgi:tetratricopeptide (TPR) repeat protein
MSSSRLRSVIGRLPTLVLVFGMGIFALGIVVQYFLNRPVVTLVGPISTPFGPIPLIGLGIAALTLLSWFLVAGIMLARQTRLHGADYAQAYRLMDEMQFTEAIPLLERSIATGKETAEVLTMLARAYAYTARYSLAHGLVERAMELYVERAAPYSALGFLFLLEGNDEQAVGAFNAAVERDPSPANWAELGYALVFARRELEALSAFEKASQQPIPAPDALRIYHRLMHLYMGAGNATKAASAAAKMVSARQGLREWEYQILLLKGTAYGQRLEREIQEISDALKEADAARLTS